MGTFSHRVAGRPEVLATTVRTLALRLWKEESSKDDPQRHQLAVKDTSPLDRRRDPLICTWIYLRER